jgi:hypothetical protein
MMYRAGSGRRNPPATAWVRIVDGGLPNLRLIDRNDSPASNLSQISERSTSDNLRTSTSYENPQLSSKVMQPSPDIAPVTRSLTRGAVGSDGGSPPEAEIAADIGGSVVGLLKY